MLFVYQARNMANKYKHLILYDGECGFCDQTIQIILQLDKKNNFVFTGLKGKTGDRILKNLPADLKNIDSIFLIENFEEQNRKIYIRSKAVFRIFWLLGGYWALLGSLCFLPACLFDWIYRVVACIRTRILPRRCFIPLENQKERFLP